LRGFVARWVIGGIFLVLFAAGSQYDLPEQGLLGVLRQNIDPAVIGAIMIYFLLGLVLISQGELALLRARWVLQKTPSKANVLRNWPVYALLLILALGVIAALLPLGGTFYLAQIIGAVIQAVYFFVFGIFRFFMTLFMLLLRLLMGEPEEAPPVEEPPVEAMPPLEALPPPGSEMPPWIGGMFFWILLALLLGYAAYIYFNGRGFTFGWLWRLWAMLQIRWRMLFGAYRQWQATRLRAARAAGATQATGRRRSWLDRLRRRDLSPDEEALFYYLDTLEQAKEAGLPRRPSETPHQYAPRLAVHLEAPQPPAATLESSKSVKTPDTPASSDPAPPTPSTSPPALPAAQSGMNAATDVSREVDTLTEAFIRVRYAGRHINATETPRLQAIWDFVKQRLRM
jgi:hypothetical protein